MFLSMHVYACIFVCMSVNAYMHMYICVDVCICDFINMYVCVYLFLDATHLGL